MKRLHFKNNKLIGIDTAEPTISVEGPRVTEVHITIAGADEIIEMTTDDKEIQDNFDKVTLSPNKEVLIKGKKPNK